MISVAHLSLQLGEFSLKDVSLDVPQGQYCVLMGKTGTGKTSILEAICGLRPILSGQILLAGRDVTNLKPAARGIGYVPQDGALFDTMSVRQNLSFALDMRRARPAMIRQRVDEMSSMLEVEHLLNRYPKNLSGGEKQRVALGRALAFRPTILLLDEPLSALDDETKHHMYDMIQRVREYANVTALHVTHSRMEAETLADLILRIDGGKVIADRASRPVDDSIAPLPIRE